MILLTEKNQIRKNIGFDLSDPDQKLAYDILEMKRGKSLSRFLAKSIIIGEMIERKMQTDKIERRGNELLNSFDNFPINTNTVSTPIVKEKRKKKKQEESVVQTKQNVEIAQTEQKESTNEVAEEVINPVTPEPEEIKIPEPVKKVEESSNEDVEDKDSTEPILDEDTLAKAMNFMAEMVKKRLTAYLLSASFFFVDSSKMLMFFGSKSVKLDV